MSTNMMYVVRRSAVKGRYCLNGIDLTGGDIVAFIHANTSLVGRIEPADRRGYVVHTQDGRRVPLSEVLFARYVASGRLA